MIDKLYKYNLYKEVTNMKASIIQLAHNDNETKQERIQKVKEIINSLDNPDLIMLPELWGIGFNSYDLYMQNSEDIYGETVSALSDIAKNKNTYIFTGSFVEKRNNSMYNTAVLLDRKGEISACYSKIHLFGDESKYLSKGDKIAVAETDLGIIGLSICYDLRFPELFRKLSEQGAEIMLSCYATHTSRKDTWEILNKARAIENQAFFLTCGCAGINCGTEYAGHSMAVSPHGMILGEAGASEEVLNIEFDVNDAREYRAEFPVLKHRVINN